MKGKAIEEISEDIRDQRRASMEFPIGREEESVTEMEGMGNTIICEEMALKMACGACEPVRDI